MLLAAHALVIRHHPSLPPTLAGVDLQVDAGEVVGVVGANGSGKSTLARALVGLVPIESGTIDGPGGRRPRVGLVLQDPAAQLVAASVADEVALGPEAAGLPGAQVATIVEDQLRLHHLVQLAHLEPTRLSGGQQQRVAVAAIEACDVDVLVLDEPTALLDPRARQRFSATVREAAAGRGVIWITQEPDEVAACDRVVVLEAGTVAWSGTAREYVAAPHVAASLGLELPAAARIAAELATRGAWQGEPPLGMRELVERLVREGSRA